MNGFIRLRERMVALFLDRYARRKAALALGLFVFVYGTTLAGDSIIHVLQFDRSAILSENQYWRLLTAHYVHFSWYHTVFNSLGLFAFGYLLFWRHPLRLWFAVLVLCPILVSLGMLGFNDVAYYRGFSGTFYSLLVLGAALKYTEDKRLSLVLIIAVMGKILLEQQPSYDIDYLEDEIGVPVMVDAHLYGALSGFAVFVVHALIARLKILTRRRPSENSK